MKKALFVLLVILSGVIGGALCLVAKSTCNPLFVLMGLVVIFAPVLMDK